MEDEPDADIGNESRTVSERVSADQAWLMELAAEGASSQGEESGTDGEESGYSDGDSGDYYIDEEEAIVSSVMPE